MCPLKSFARRSKTSGEERASAMPLLIVAITFAGLCAIGLAKVSGAALQRSQAQQAADAAALAGARYGFTDALRMASANGAVIVSYADRYSGAAHEVDVSVSLNSSGATASARWDPPPPPPPPPTTLASTTTSAPSSTVVSDTTSPPSIP
jgi:Flp pilus assembly protein TadG